MPNHVGWLIGFLQRTLVLHEIVHKDSRAPPLDKGRRICLINT
jgi:hypothetical protein